MKQFNLEEYLANPSRKVVTRDGRDVRIICTDAKIESTPIVALITQSNGDDEALVTYRRDGKFMEEYDANCDLFFASKKHEGWINIFKGVGFNYVGAAYIYNSREEAEIYKTNFSDYVATIKIEWEE